MSCTQISRILYQTIGGGMCHVFAKSRCSKRWNVFLSKAQRTCSQSQYFSKVFL